MSHVRKSAEVPYTAEQMYRRVPWYHPTLAEILTYPLEELADKIKG